LDQLQRDLESAVLRRDGKTWLSIVVENDPAQLARRGWLLDGQPTIKPLALSTELVPAITPPGIRDARFGRGGVWLRLVSTGLSSSGGRPVAVSYQINRRPVIGPVTATNRAAVRYLFLREELTPNATLAATQVLFSSKAEPAALVTAELTGALAINVVDFGVWLYERDASNQLRRIFPSSPTSPTEYAAPLAGAPVEADLMVRILTEKGATVIAAMESGLIPPPPEYRANAPAWWWAVVEANSEVHVRRVRILNATP